MLAVKSAILSFLKANISFPALDLSSFGRKREVREMTTFQEIIAQKPGRADKRASNPGLGNLSNNTDLKFLKVLEKYIFAATKI